MKWLPWWYLCVWRKESTEKDGGWGRVPFICLFNMRPCNTIFVSLRRQSHAPLWTFSTPTKSMAPLFVTCMYVVCLSCMCISIYKMENEPTATGWPDLGRLGGRFSFGLEQGLCTKLQTFLHVPRMMWASATGWLIYWMSSHFNGQEEHAMFAYTVCMFIDRLSISFCLGAPLNGQVYFSFLPMLSNLGGWIDTKSKYLLHTTMLPCKVQQRQAQWC